MKKAVRFLFLAILFFGVAGLIAVPSEAVEKSGAAGKSNVAHLYLFEKNSTDWTVVEGGAWGKMTYRIARPNFKFVFNGHDLEPGYEYTLIYYPDPWPGNGLICLGSAVADEYGDVHIKSTRKNPLNIGDLPASYDANFGEGAKIWLVLSQDVSCDTDPAMVGWNPAEYLFEAQLMTYDDTDE